MKIFIFIPNILLLYQTCSLDYPQCSRTANRLAGSEDEDPVTDARYTGTLSNAKPPNYCKTKSTTLEAIKLH